MDRSTFLMELNEYQRLANRTDQQPQSESVGPEQPSLLVPLLGMAGEVGELLGEHKKWLRDGDSYQLLPERVKEELGDILWYLSCLATKHDLKLEDVAEYNLTKIEARWRSIVRENQRRTFFDDGYPPEEQLPRKMDVSIRSVGEREVETLINNMSFGEQLRDNRYDDDGYRFHDVFHISYATFLGWSPMVRSLLQRKRKSDPLVDEVEDGGRSRVIEEGISAMVFSYAENRKFLEGAGGIDAGLLRTIKGMTAHLEVRNRTEADWEEAITEGFKLWRCVKDRGHAEFCADLLNRELTLIG